jgi:hypothetical protein
LGFFFGLSADGWSALLFPKARFDKVVSGGFCHRRERNIETVLGMDGPESLTLFRDCLSIDVAFSSTPAKTERCEFEPFDKQRKFGCV